MQCCRTSNLVQSFVSSDRKQTFCIYDAPSHEAIPRQPDPSLQARGVSRMSIRRFHRE